MTRPDSSDPDLPVPPSEAALAAFCEYLRLLELGQDVDWQSFCEEHGQVSAELQRLLAEYDRVTAILDRLSPEASFSERLRARYGDSVDPGISLSVDTGRGPSSPSSGTAGGPASDVLGRLASSSGEGRRYEPRREIARGGMGAILEVWDGELRRTLAMKMVLPAALDGAGDSSEGQAERRLSRFLEEAQITGQLDHPGIVPVHDIGIDEQGNVFFTMQLVDGLDLRKVFELARLERDGWNQRRVVGVLIRVCEAMAYAHSKGVIHRDLKPANIMVGRFGEAFVMDWGLAKVVGVANNGEADAPSESVGAERAPALHTLRSDEESGGDGALKTLDGDVVGTPAYMSPEQARGQLERLGPRSDVYSIGAMLYHLLSGHMPYEPLGERAAAHAILKAVRNSPPWPIQQLNPDVDEELAAICSKAMAREPEDRYREVMSLGDELRAWVEGRGVQAFTTGVLYETRKWMERNRGTTLALLALIFFAMISVLLFIWQQQLNVSRLRDEQQLASQANRQKDDAEAVLKQTVAQLRDNQQELLEKAGLAQRAIEQAQEDERRAREATQRANEAAELARASELAATQSAYRSHINAASYSLRLNAVQEARAHLEECPPSRRGWEWQHLSLGTDASLGAPIVQEGGLLGLMSSRTGEVLLSYGLGVPVRAWQTSNSRTLGELEVLSGPSPIGFGRTQVQSHAALHPSGELAVISSPNGYAQLFNVASGAPLVSYRSKADAVEPIAALAITSDQELVVTATSGGMIRVYQLLSGQELRSFGPVTETSPAGEPVLLTCLALDPGGEFLVAGDALGSAVVWSLERGERLATLTGAHAQGLKALHVSSDRSLVATASMDGGAAVWERETGVLQSMAHGHRGAVSAVRFTAQGRVLVTGGEDSTVRTWLTSSGRPQRVLHGHEGPVTALVELADYGQLASASLDGTIRRWDLGWNPAQDRYAYAQGDAAVGLVHSLCLAPTGREFLWGSSEGMRAVELVDGQDHRIYSVDPEQEVSALVLIAMDLSPNGQILALSQGDRSLELRAAESGVLLRRLETPGWAARQLSFSADSRFLAVGGRSKQALIVDVRGELPDVTVHLSSQRPGFGRSLRALALAPDGTRLATVDSEGDLRLWDARSGALIESSRNVHRASVTTVAFSPTGSQLATASGDHLVKLWNASDLELLRVLEGHGAGVSQLAYTPDGQRLASAGSDGQVWLWDPEAGEGLLELQTASDSAVGLCFTASGDALLAAGTEGVTVWHTREGSARYRQRRAARRVQLEASALARELLSSSASPLRAEAELLQDDSLSTQVQTRARYLLEDARGSLRSAALHLEPLLLTRETPAELLESAADWLMLRELVDERSASWHQLMGALAARMGDTSRALAHFDREAELGELDARDWLFRALAYLDAGEPTSAAEALARASTLPTDQDLRLVTLKNEVASLLDEATDG